MGPWTLLLASLLLTLTSAHAQEIWFGDPITTQLPETPSQFAVDHLNGDPHLDVAFVSSTSKLYVHLNDGTGRFYEQWVYPGARNRAIGTGDLNSDGAADIVVGDFTEESFLLYYNLGFGFSEPIEVETIRKVWFARIANLDGDAWGDVVVVSNGTITIHWGGPGGPGASDVHNLALHPGDCGHATVPIEMKIADLTGNGLLDIAVLVTSAPDCPPGEQEKGLGLLWNLGNRVFPGGVAWPFREPTENTDDWLEDFDVADLNNDSLLDFGVVNEAPWHAPMRLFLSVGNSSFEEVPGVDNFPGSFLAFGDMDGDEKSDLVWSKRYTTGSMVEKGNGAAQFQIQQSLEVMLRDVAVAELDGNPRPELIGYHGGDLHVVPNLTYLDPSAVDEPERNVQPALRVSPSIVAGGGCWIEFTGSSAQSTAIEVLDILGRRRATLRTRAGTGTHSIHWAGTDHQGQRLPSGVYWIHSRDVSAGPATRVVILR
jgi:hypothetical protein